MLVVLREIASTSCSKSSILFIPGVSPVLRTKSPLIRRLKPCLTEADPQSLLLQLSILANCTNSHRTTHNIQSILKRVPRRDCVPTSNASPLLLRTWQCAQTSLFPVHFDLEDKIVVGIVRRRSRLEHKHLFPFRIRHIARSRRGRLVLFATKRTRTN